MSTIDNKKGEATARTNSTTAASRFDLENHEAWLEHLHNEGYVVVKSILTPQQINEAIDLLWTHIESDLSPQDIAIDRNDVETWDAWHLDERGIIAGRTAQCQGAWYVRGMSRIKQVFTQIWKTDNLLVSMDAVFAWRPFWLRQEWTPYTEGLHLDQNPFEKPEFCCVQGMVPLYDVTEEIGGLEVVRQSHMDEAKAEFRARYDNKRSRRHGDWFPLDSTDPMQGHGELVLACAGDLILWDSRTVHGGRVGSRTYKATSAQHESTTRNNCQLARLSVPVCMTPRAWAKDNVAPDRRNAFERGDCLSHWPHERASVGGHRTGGSSNYNPVELTPEQKALI